MATKKGALVSKSALVVARKPFFPWIYKVSKLCLKQNYRDEVFNEAKWDEYFKEGLSPKKALDRRMLFLTIGMLKGALATMEAT